MKKVKIKALNGYIYVESFNGKHNEENDRAKIYDENMAYIDYICLDGVDKKQYKNELKALADAKDFCEFADLLGYTSYDFSDNLGYLLASIFDDCDDAEWEEIENKLQTMAEQDILTEYCINRIGNTYFYLGIY